jgi:hypothetical protein
MVWRLMAASAIGAEALLAFDANFCFGSLG